jgi:hypothetical protein
MTKQGIYATHLFQDLRLKHYMGDLGVERTRIFKLILEKYALKKEIDQK